MSIEANKNNARRFFDAWNAKTPDALDEFTASEFVTHSPLPGVSPNLAGMKQWMSIVSEGFPDINFKVVSQIGEGDLVSTRWSCKGTHTADFLGVPATSKSVVVSGIVISRIADGKTRETWGEWDAMGLMRQLGVVPEPSAAAGA